MPDSDDVSDASILLAKRINIFFTGRPDPDHDPNFGPLPEFIERVLHNSFDHHIDDRAYLASYIFDLLSKRSDWDILRHVHGRHLLATILLGLATVVSRGGDINDEGVQKDAARFWGRIMLCNGSYGELCGQDFTSVASALEGLFSEGWEGALRRLRKPSENTTHIGLRGLQRFRETNTLHQRLTDEPPGSQTGSSDDANQVAVQHHQHRNYRSPQESGSAPGQYTSPRPQPAHDPQPGPSRLHNHSPGPPTTSTSPDSSGSLPSPPADVSYFPPVRPIENDEHESNRLISRLFPPGSVIRPLDPCLE